MAEEEEEEGRRGQIAGIRIPDYLRPVYANYANINHTPWDFRLTFALARAPVPGPEREAVGERIEPDAVADVIVPANVVHGLIMALQQNYNKYLERFGPPGFQTEGPQPQAE
jgi:hypothetical protein